MIEKTIQLKPIGDEPFEVYTIMDLQTAMELGQMVGQIFELQNVSCNEHGETTFRFVPDNGMAKIEDAS